MEAIPNEIPVSQDELAAYIRPSRIITNKILNELQKNVYKYCIHP